MSANKLAAGLVVAGIAVMAGIGLTKCSGGTSTSVEAVGETTGEAVGSATETVLDTATESATTLVEVVENPTEAVTDNPEGSGDVSESAENPEEPAVTETTQAAQPAAAEQAPDGSGDVVGETNETTEERGDPEEMAAALLAVRDGGGAYSVAKETLVAAGWAPRLLEEGQRIDDLDDTESALIGGGFGELESCEGEARVICRFEFIDGAGGIAAVLTAGKDADPRVVDAFMMKVE